jgi:hypothetical protein
VLFRIREYFLYHAITTNKNKISSFFLSIARVETLLDRPTC